MQTSMKLWLTAFAAIFAQITEANTNQGHFLRRLVNAATTPLKARTSLPEWPHVRFQPWESLKVADQITVRDSLGYKKKEWNTPGEADIELLSFETINLTSLGLLVDADVQIDRAGDMSAIDAIMQVLNITEWETWDCHINHYRDYFWEELQEGNVSQYFEALGWTPAMWEGKEDYPDTEEFEWFELDADQTTAAYALCYFGDLWGEIEIGDWTYKPPNGRPGLFGIGNATSAVNLTDVARTDVSPWDLPWVRFVQWNNLDPAYQTFAKILGYNATTWDNPGTGLENERNATGYEDLTQVELAAAHGLGFDKFYWDCLIQHYNSYKWNELPGQGVQGFLKILGWNASTWHGLLPPPPSDTMPYDQLTPQQQNAADQLCYLPETYERGSKLSAINAQSLTAPPS